MLLRSMSLAAAVVLLAAGCGSSSTTVAGPSGVRCAVTVGADTLTVPAGGASGQFEVNANRECTWTAVPEAGWISITAGASGQGDGRVTYRAAANPAAAPRTGAITVNQQRVQLAQAAAACQFSIQPDDETYGASGGTTDVTVSTSPGCGWTAVSETSWITIESGQSGTGNGTVRVRVASNSGPARSGTARIAGRTFSASQGAPSGEPPPTDPPNPGPAPAPPTPAPEPEPEPAPPACTLNVTPTTVDAPAGGAAQTVTVTASDAACTWTSVSNAAWLVITSGASGTGTGPVAFTVAPNPATSPRTGTLTVAGRTVSVTQAAAAAPEPCSFSVSPTSANVGAGGTSNNRIDVTASESTCGWTASSGADWITITDGASGTGNGTVRYSVAPNTSASPRSGTITVATRTVTITQPGMSCAYSVSPTSVSVPVEGRLTNAIDVSTADGCTWTASSGAGWILITSGSSGTGDGEVVFSVAPNAGIASRTGTLTVAGHTVTVEQAGVGSLLVELQGAMSGLAGSCPTLTFTVSGETVRTNASTVFEGGSCNSLGNGKTVEVEGERQGDGTVLASLVRKL